jgi:DNA-binding transcriptional ArsR family regulator
VPETKTKKLSATEEQQIYRLQAEICRVLGHPRRIEILNLLESGEKSASALLRRLRISKANLSQHLAVMRHTALVESRRDGREVFYRLSFPEITEACCAIREVLVQRLKKQRRLEQELGSEAAAGMQGSS